MKLLKILIIFIVIIIFTNFVSASDAIPVPKSIVESNSEFLIDRWDELPFKHMKANLSWVLDVNYNYNPVYGEWIETGYDENNEKISPRCLGYSAATVADWYSLQTGKPLGTYRNYINNRTEKGHNPRELEAIYYERWTPWSLIYDYLGIDVRVTKEPIPYDLKGYADILTNSPVDWQNEDDPNLPTSDFKYTVEPDEYLFEGRSENLKRVIPFISNKKKLQEALRKFGILYAQLDSTLVGWDKFGIEFPIHAITIIGYGEYSGEDVFFIHETWDTEYINSSFEEVQYKAVDVWDIGVVLGFLDPSWPTYHHDNRRTGFTLLKGDITSPSKLDKINMVLQGNVTEDVVSRPSIADVDNDEHMDMVITTGPTMNDGLIYSLEYYKPWYWYEPITIDGWKLQIWRNILATPTIANIDTDSNKEVMFGIWNGTFYAIDVLGEKSASVRWTYTVNPVEGFTGALGNSAIGDIDNDGTNEIIFMDDVSGNPSWSGSVYVLRDNGNSAYLEAKYNISNGGGFGAISLANVDSDDNLEIIAPSYYGVYVLDYSKLVGENNEF